MAIVEWLPKRNTERTAHKLHSVWETDRKIGTVSFGVLKGIECMSIYPLNMPDEARWVPLNQIRKINE